MRTGQLRHRIGIQRKFEKKSGRLPEFTWITILTTWAAIQPLSGREKTQANQVHATTTHRIRTRYLSELEVTDRIRFNGRLFNIESIINIDERNKELEILCQEQK